MQGCSWKVVLQVLEMFIGKTFKKHPPWISFFSGNEEFISNRNSTFSHVLFHVMLKFLNISVRSLRDVAVCTEISHMLGDWQQRMYQERKIFSLGALSFFDVNSSLSNC